MVVSVYQFGAFLMTLAFTYAAGKDRCPRHLAFFLTRMSNKCTKRPGIYNRHLQSNCNAGQARYTCTNSYVEPIRQL